MDKKKVNNILKGAAAAGALYGGANVASGPDVVFAATLDEEAAGTVTDETDALEAETQTESLNEFVDVVTGERANVSYDATETADITAQTSVTTETADMTTQTSVTTETAAEIPTNNSDVTVANNETATQNAETEASNAETQANNQEIAAKNTETAEENKKIIEENGEEAPETPEEPSAELPDPVDEPETKTPTNNSEVAADNKKIDEANEEIDEDNEEIEAATEKVENYKENLTEYNKDLKKVENKINDKIEDDNTEIMLDNEDNALENDYVLRHNAWAAAKNAGIEEIDDSGIEWKNASADLKVAKSIFNLATKIFNEKSDAFANLKIGVEDARTVMDKAEDAMNDAWDDMHGAEDTSEYNEAVKAYKDARDAYESAMSDYEDARAVYAGDIVQYKDAVAAMNKSIANYNASVDTGDDNVYKLGFGKDGTITYNDGVLSENAKAALANAGIQTIDTNSADWKNTTAALKKVAFNYNQAVEKFNEQSEAFAEKDTALKTAEEAMKEAEKARDAAQGTDEFNAAVKAFNKASRDYQKAKKEYDEAETDYNDDLSAFTNSINTIKKAISDYNSQTVKKDDSVYYDNYRIVNNNLAVLSENAQAAAANADIQTIDVEDTKWEDITNPKLLSARDTYNTAVEKFNSATEKFTAYKTDLADLAKAMDDAETEMTKANGTADFNSAESKYNEAAERYKEAADNYNTVESEYSRAIGGYKAAVKSITAAISEYNSRIAYNDVNDTKTVNTIIGSNAKILTANVSTVAENAQIQQISKDDTVWSGITDQSMLDAKDAYNAEVESFVNDSVEFASYETKFGAAADAMKSAETAMYQAKGTADFNEAVIAFNNAVKLYEDQKTEYDKALESYNASVAKYNKAADAINAAIDKYNSDVKAENLSSLKNIDLTVFDDNAKLISANDKLPGISELSGYSDIQKMLYSDFDELNQFHASLQNLLTLIKHESGAAAELSDEEKKYYDLTLDQYTKNTESAENNESFYNFLVDIYNAEWDEYQTWLDDNLNTDILEYNNIISNYKYTETETTGGVTESTVAYDLSTNHIDVKTDAAVTIEKVIDENGNVSYEVKTGSKVAGIGADRDSVKTDDNAVVSIQYSSHGKEFNTESLKYNAGTIEYRHTQGDHGDSNNSVLFSAGEAYPNAAIKFSVKYSDSDEVIDVILNCNSVYSENTYLEYTTSNNSEHGGRGGFGGPSSQTTAEKIAEYFGLTEDNGKVITVGGTKYLDISNLNVFEVSSVACNGTNVNGYKKADLSGLDLVLSSETIKANAHIAQALKTVTAKTAETLSNVVDNVASDAAKAVEGIKDIGAWMTSMLDYKVTDNSKQVSQLNDVNNIKTMDTMLNYEVTDTPQSVKGLLDWNCRMNYEISDVKDESHKLSNKDIKEMGDLKEKITLTPLTIEGLEGYEKLDTLYRYYDIPDVVVERTDTDVSRFVYIPGTSTTTENTTVETSRAAFGVKVDTDAQEVLGASRAVTGTRAKGDGAVLGAQRTAKTGDPAAIAGAAGAIAAAGAAGGGFLFGRRNKDKKNDK